MKVERITYQQTFPTGPYMNVKLGLEISLDAHNDLNNGEEAFDESSEAFDMAKTICESSFKEMFPNIGEVVTYGDSNVVGEYSQNGNTIGNGIVTTTSPNPKQKRKEEVVASLMLAIELASSKTATEFFRKRVQDIKDEKLTEAFENKLKQFV